MNKELLDKLKALTNSTIEVESHSLLRETEQKEQTNISIRRGNPKEIRATKNRQLKNQLNDIFN